MRSRCTGVVLATLFLLTGSACRNGRSEPTGATSTGAATAPVVVLHSGTRSIPIRVELARTEPERERGLMYRNHMDADAGMLFLFPRQGPLTFWMKNTFIPLDMIFIDSQRRIIGIVEEAVPETETARRVDGESQFVLEIGGGIARRLGVAAGGEVEFRGIAAQDIPN